MSAPLLYTISAPILGIAFGWFLERGGLGYSPKLAGQFYRTDLTVFRMMFSALITAMLGAFWLDRFGVLDLGSVYLPETFLVPQAIGGMLFGIGFITAGLCPGTSCVAAASGRADGLYAICGILIGILVFDSAFPWIEGFYNSTPLGAVSFPSLFGFPHGVGVCFITAAALIGFSFSRRLERKA